MQKQALKGLFFNISTYFSPLLAVFLTGENSLMFFRLPSHLYHLVCRAHKTSPHAATACLYNEGVPFLPNRPFPSAQPSPFGLSVNVLILSNSFQSFPNWKELERSCVGVTAAPVPSLRCKTKRFVGVSPCLVAEIAKFRKFQCLKNISLFPPYYTSFKMRKPY